MKDYLINLCSYNVWANNKLLQFVTNAGESACTLNQNSSFSTVKDTIIHILNAQLIWMNRINKTDEMHGIQTDYNQSSGELCKFLVESSSQWLRFVQHMNDAFSSEIIHYKNLSGKPFNNTVVEIITHVMNHSTFHRGQIITMLRHAGFEKFESTDLISWYRLKP